MSMLKPHVCCAALLMLAVLPLSGCGDKAEQSAQKKNHAQSDVLIEPVTLEENITAEAAQWLPSLSFLPTAEMLVSDEMNLSLIHI